MGSGGATNDEQFFPALCVRALCLCHKIPPTVSSPLKTCWIIATACVMVVSYESRCYRCLRILRRAAREIAPRSSECHVVGGHFTHTRGEAAVAGHSIASRRGSWTEVLGF